MSDVVFPVPPNLHYSWNNRNVNLHIALTKLNEQMMKTIPNLSFEQGPIRVIMRLIRMWSNAGFQDFAKCCLSWAEAAMDCAREDWDRYLIAGAALCALDNHPLFSGAIGSISPRNDAYAKIALRYLSLYQHVEFLDKFDPSPARPAAAIVALQIIRVECSDVERPMPKKYILGRQFIHVLTRAVAKNAKSPVHFRPLALEIFTLIGGMWFDPWVDEIPPEEKLQFIIALGNVLDAPNLTFKNRDPITPWPPAEAVINYQEMFEGRTGSFVHRSPRAYLIPLLFGLCSSKSWQASLNKSTFDFISHATFNPNHWAMWLRHTWKLIVRDGRLDIELIVIKLKELERYDVLALVIKSMWLSPDPDMFTPRHWEWVERETLGLFKVQRGPAWRPLEGYFPTILRTYVEPASGNSRNPPGAAVRRIFQYDKRLDDPVRKKFISLGAESVIQCYHFEVDQPKDWRIRQVCMIQRLRQVLAREMKPERLRVFRECRENQSEVPPTSDGSTKDLSPFVYDHP